MCTASDLVAATRRLFGAHAANFEEWECELVLQFNMAQMHDALSLVNLYFVAATCRRRVHTLRQQCFAHFVAAICRMNSNWFEFV